MAVVQTGSFAAAAEQRCLTQSAFSRRIRTIEAHLGVDLFDRSRKPVRAQRIGADQQAQIMRAVRLLRQIAEELKRGTGDADNRLVMASQHALSTSHAPAVLHRILARHARVNLRLRSANSSECLRLLLAREADFALMYRNANMPEAMPPADIEAQVIGSERLIPVAAAAAAGQIEQALAEGSLPVIAYPPDVFLGRAVADLILPRIDPGLRLVARVETALTHAALELAGAGIGLAWLPAALARSAIDAGRLVDLSARLPAARLEVAALRLCTNNRSVAQLAWEELARKAP